MFKLFNATPLSFIRVDVFDALAFICLEEEGLSDLSAEVASPLTALTFF